MFKSFGRTKNQNQDLQRVVFRHRRHRRRRRLRRRNRVSFVSTENDLVRSFHFNDIVCRRRRRNQPVDELKRSRRRRRRRGCHPRRRRGCRAANRLRLQKQQQALPTPRPPPLQVDPERWKSCHQRRLPLKTTFWVVEKSTTTTTTTTNARLHRGLFKRFQSDLSLTLSRDFFFASSLSLSPLSLPF